MLFPFASPATDAGSNSANGGLFGGSTMFFLIAIVAVMGVMMWFSSRSKKRQLAAEEEKRSNLVPGTEVVMRGGLYGTIVSSDEDSVTIASVDGSQTRWMKAAVGRIIEPEVIEQLPDDDEGTGTQGPSDKGDKGEPDGDTPGYIKP